MSDKNIELIENTEIRRMKISSKEEYSYSIEKKSGIFKTKPDSGSTVEIIEPGPDIRPQFRKNGKIKNYVTGLDPSIVSSESAGLAALLDSLSLDSWEIILKSINKMSVISAGKKSIKNFFNHNSALIRIRTGEETDVIEIGEGNTRGNKLNYSGLMSRTKSVVNCGRQAVKSRFRYELPVILAPGDGGIIFHEIFGHSLEADHIADGSSPFTTNDLGKKVVSDDLTIAFKDGKDDFFKNINCDDEGVRTRPKYMIQQGVLKSFISDQRYGNILGTGSSGFGRQEDFSHLPIPRMFSIYISPGKFHPGEIISTVKKGIFAAEMGDAKVIFQKNIFYFFINSAFMIREGKISEPLGRVLVSGKLDKIFQSIEMVGTDFQYDRGVSYCQKKGQLINVRIGQPTVKIGALTISGENGG